MTGQPVLRWVAAGVAALLLSFAHPAAAATEEPESPQPNRVAATRLQVSGLPAAESREHLAADADGNVFIFRELEGRAYSVDESGAAELHSELEIEPGSRPSGRRAAVGGEGRTWAFLGSGPQGEVRLFRKGKEVGLADPRWLTTGVAVSESGDPVLAQAPVMMGSIDPRSLPAAARKPPLLSTLRRDAWKALADPLYVDRPNRADGNPRLMMSDSLLAVATSGQILLAKSLTYDLRIYEPSGSLYARLTRHGGAPREEEIPAALLEDLAEGEADLLQGRKRLSRMISAVAWSPDGEALAISRGDDGWGIDRYSKASQTLQRLPITGLGEVTSLNAASGRNGLFLAARGDCSRLYWLDWDDLLAASWVRPSSSASCPRAASRAACACG